MSQKMVWNLLILFGILCQGIIGTLSEKDIVESSELLVRQKRVINRNPGGDKKESIRNFPFVVAVKETRIRGFCAGVILTHQVVLTVAKCVVAPEEMLRVYSGTTQFSNHGHSLVHAVTNKRTNLGNHLYRPDDGIALVTISPSLEYSVNTHNIEFYEGPIHPGANAFVAGWGCNPVGHPGTAYPDRLRSITVPIISNYDCMMLYLRTFAISDIDICTLDASGNQYCGVDDAGAPLVLKVDEVYKLAGVHLWNGAVIGRSNPDVFVNLQHPTYKTWIAETIHSLEAHLNNPNQNHNLPHNTINQEHLRHLHNLPHHPNFQ